MQQYYADPLQQATSIVTHWVRRNDPTQVLNLIDLGLTKLPDIPHNCQILFCGRNKLTSLPDLPNCRFLCCDDNNLTSLPDLPNCQTLNCYYNKLTSLPELQNCQFLNCNNNKLTCLPNLINCDYLACANNQLTVLPDLPNCTGINCSNNQLLYLPKLPLCDSLTFFGNSIRAYPQVGTHCVVEFDCKYMYISKKQAGGGLVETPNYNKCAHVIQRNFKKYLRRKYTKLAHVYIMRDPSKIVGSYIA
jgi:hypothetical protein